MYKLNKLNSLQLYIMNCSLYERMTNCTTSDLKVYVDYLLCYGYSNRIMKFISYLRQLSLMLGNDIVKVLHELKFYLI